MRPAFFGEVVFPRSRAVDVDFGDDFEEVVPIAYKIQVEEERNVSELVPGLKNFVLACGLHPSNFAKVHLIPDPSKSELVFTVKVIRQIQKNSDDTSEQNLGNDTNPTSVMEFFHVPGINSLVGVTASKYPPDVAAAPLVTNKIFEYLSAISSILTVFVLDFKPSALFQSINRPEMEYGIFRALISSKEKTVNKDKIRELEVPNMLDGLAASVMTHCELTGIRANVYILYGSDIADATSINIGIYRNQLERVEIWKTQFLCQENVAVVKKKLETLLRRNIPLASVFG